MNFLPRGGTCFLTCIFHVCVVFPTQLVYKGDSLLHQYCVVCKQYMTSKNNICCFL